MNAHEYFSDCPQTAGPYVLQDSDYVGETPSHLADFSSYLQSDDPADNWWMPNLTSGSDYSGTLVHRANCTSVMEHASECEHCRDRVVEVCGGAGSFGVAVRGDVECPDLFGMFDALADYPVLDDDAHSALEAEAEAEAWENWACADFVCALQRRIDDPEDPAFLDSEALGRDAEIDDDLTCGDLGWDAAGTAADYPAVNYVFDCARVAANEYWENESGDSIYIDVAKCAEHADPTMVRQLIRD